MALLALVRDVPVKRLVGMVEHPCPGEFTWARGHLPGPGVWRVHCPLLAPGAVLSSVCYPERAFRSPNDSSCGLSVGKNVCGVVGNSRERMFIPADNHGV